jgi:hypothetical protein
MWAELAILGEFEPDADACSRRDGLLAAVRSNGGFDRLDGFDGDPRLVEQNIARLIEKAAGEVHVNRGPLLAAGRRESRQPWCAGRSIGDKETRRQGDKETE